MWVEQTVKENLSTVEARIAIIFVAVWGSKFVEKEGRANILTLENKGIVKTNQNLLNVHRITVNKRNGWSWVLTLVYFLFIVILRIFQLC